MQIVERKKRDERPYLCNGQPQGFSPAKPATRSAINTPSAKYTHTIARPGMRAFSTSGTKRASACGRGRPHVDASGPSQERAPAPRSQTRRARPSTAALPRDRTMYPGLISSTTTGTMPQPAHGSNAVETKTARKACSPHRRRPDGKGLPASGASASIPRGALRQK